MNLHLIYVLKRSLLTSFMLRALSDCGEPCVAHFNWGASCTQLYLAVALLIKRVWDGGPLSSGFIADTSTFISIQGKKI